MLIQLIEDDARLAAVIAESFQTRGARVETFCKGGTALAAQRDHLYDVVLLDLGLPDQDGLEVLRTMRAARNSVPVLVLTSHGDVADRIEGLDAGADDYLTKPFDLGELAARVNALLRRAREFTEDLLTAGDLTFDSINRDTRVGDVPIDLTEREAALLELLLRRNGKVLRAGRKGNLPRQRRAGGEFGRGPGAPAAHETEGIPDRNRHPNGTQDRL
jgi:DNA-binding response OmpR family regulator